MSFSFDKVTTGTYSFVSVILNVAPDGATIAGGSLLFPAALTIISAKTQFSNQVRIISTSQLINNISKLLQKLLKCFNVTTASVSVNESLSCAFPTMLVLYLKDSELVESGSLGWSL